MLQYMHFLLTLNKILSDEHQNQSKLPCLHHVLLLGFMLFRYVSATRGSLADILCPLIADLLCVCGHTENIVDVVDFAQHALI